MIVYHIITYHIVSFFIYTVYVCGGRIVTREREKERKKKRKKERLTFASFAVNCPATFRTFVCFRFKSFMAALIA